MNVTDRVVLRVGHSVEFGNATWNPDVQSVRNRYDNEDGTFSPRGSSELPIPDLVHIIVESARRDIIEPEHAERMIGALIASIARRSITDRAG
jgi:butyrate kinase